MRWHVFFYTHRTKEFEMMRLILLFTKIFLMIPLILMASRAPGLHAGEFDWFYSLKKHLIHDGFNAKGIQALYADPRVGFELRGISLYFIHSESKLNYDQFLEESQIQKAAAYMQTHQEALIHAEKAFGVHRHVITAILLVETRLGTYVGTRSVLNTLSTMAALADKKVRDNFWKQIKDKTHLSRSEFTAKAKRKAGWAYAELKAFLKYVHKENLNPYEINGSYAGALGFCQFIPSNILTLARDGNGDGRIDLFNHADAIMSIASYLNNYGWHSEITDKETYDVVYTYNHSEYYVNTVLQISKMLRG
jgi:membrane-bound lytic murein transglycosylase B